MRQRILLPVLLAMALILPMAAAEAEAGIKDQLQELVKKAIENISLNAEDIVAAAGLKYSPIKGLVDLDLKITPIDLKKRPGKIEFVDLTTIRAIAAFEFLGHYNLLLNEKSIRENDIKMVGEGAINIKFKGLKIKIDDIPSLVLKLADRENECPNIGQIKRSAKVVPPGGKYTVDTQIQSNSPGHLAYFLFANNKAAVSPQPTLRTVLARDPAYSGTLTIRNDVPPDRYFGNVMAVELICKDKKFFDPKAYDVLFSTGITVIGVE